MSDTVAPVVKVRWWRRASVWRRIASDAGATLVGLNAAVLSWKHIVETAIVYGREAEWAAYLYPLSIDGMMVVGVVKAADDRASGRQVRGWARVATWLGGILSIAAQIMSALPYAIAAVVASAPSITLIVVVEVMARRGKLLSPDGKRRWFRRPVTSAVESSPEDAPAVPTPEAPPADTVAVEPSGEPVSVSASEDVPAPRARRAPAATTEHQRPKRNRRKPAGRGYPGVDAGTESEATAVAVEPESDAMGEDTASAAVSEPAEPVAV